MLPRSLPAFGSVMQMAPIFSPRSAGMSKRLRMSSLPSSSRNLVPMSDCMVTQPASDIEPRAISSSARHSVTRSVSSPPTSAG